MNPFLILIDSALGIYAFILIVSIILSWLVAFDIVNRHNPFVSKVMYALYQITEPVLKPIRKFMPELGGLDLSPIIVFLLIQFIRNSLRYYVAPMM